MEENEGSWKPPEDKDNRNQKETPVQFLDSYDEDNRTLMVIFSHKLEIPEKVADIREKKAILLQLLQDETSLVEDPALLGFEWTIETFEEYRMIILVQFDHPEYVSSGIVRDQWELTIKDPSYFISQKT